MFSKKIIKRAPIFLACIVLSLFAAATLKANTLQEQAMEEGKNITSNLYPQLHLELQDPVPVYDTNNKLTGLSLSVFWRGVPYGYMVYNTKHKQITDFSIEPCTVGLDEACDSTSIKTSKKESRIYTNGLDYSSNRNVEKEDSSASRNSSQVKWEDIITLRPGGTRVKIYEKWLKNRYSFSQKTIENVTHKYACAVVALLNIARQNNLMGNSEKDIRTCFNQLWKLSKTKVYKKKKYSNYYIEYGETYDKDTASALKQFCENHSKKKTNVKLYEKADFDLFKKGLDHNYSGTISATPQNEVRHVMSVIGYYKCHRKGDSKYIYNYLIVADGWNNNFRYIDIKHSSLKQINAIFACIK